MAAPKIVTVKATSLVQDFDIYPRAQVDGYHVREIAEALKAGADLPPIIVERRTKRVVDGFHRLRAHQSVSGANATVSVVYRDYPDEAALLRESIELNAGHGRNLTLYDKTRCIVLAEQHGISRADVAKALNITRKRADNLVMERVSAKGDVLKRTMSHFAGQELTSEQRDYNQRAGGLDQSFYINQVIALLETDSINWESPKVVSPLKKLHGLLSDKIAA